MNEFKVGDYVKIKDQVQLDGMNNDRVRNACFSLDKKYKIVGMRENDPIIISDNGRQDWYWQSRFILANDEKLEDHEMNEKQVEWNVGDKFKYRSQLYVNNINDDGADVTYGRKYTVHEIDEEGRIHFHDDVGDLYWESKDKFIKVEDGEKMNDKQIEWKVGDECCINVEGVVERFGENERVFFTENKKYKITRFRDFVSEKRATLVADEGSEHHIPMNLIYKPKAESEMTEQKRDWKVGDEFTIEDELCKWYPQLYTKGKVYVVEKIDSSGYPYFLNDEGGLVWTNVEMIPVQQNDRKNEMKSDGFEASKKLISIQDKLEYLHLSPQAINDISSMIVEYGSLCFADGKQQAENEEVKKFQEKMDALKKMLAN